jgi:L-fuculose-phosphate aldolase
MPAVSEAEFRAEITRFCHLIYQKSYVASTDGNISVRLPDGHVMCTPTICNKGFVKPEDMVIIDAKGRLIKGERKASSEIAMHSVRGRGNPPEQGAHIGSGAGAGLHSLG